MLGAAAPASAHISQFDRISIGASYVSDHVDADGTITCTAGETFRVSIRGRQKVSGYSGIGITNDTCTGSEQNWSVQSTSNSGDLVCTERVFIFLLAKTFSGGVVDDKERIDFIFPAVC